MSIDLDVDSENVLSLGQWLESEEAGKTQKQIEEKIFNILFSHDRESPAFLQMLSQLAWIGSRPEKKPLLEREIIVLNSLNGFSPEQCNLLKDAGKLCCKAGSFIADHAVEIVVGAAICATGIGIACVTGYTLSASVGGIVVAGAGSVFCSEEKPNPKIPSIPLPNPRACSKEELAILQPQPLSLPYIELPSSAYALLVTADGIWANDQFFSTETLKKNSLFSSILTKGSEEVSSTGFSGMDWKSFTYYSYLAEQIDQEISGKILPHQERGEKALVLGYYDQAVLDFEKAIQANPNDSTAYLERGIALFELGEYDSSLEDYQQFLSQNQTTPPLSLSEFSLNFAKGLKQGVYDSGKGMLLFLTDFIKNPIQTSKQVVDSITTLASLVRNDEWETIAEALSPEMHQLVTEWDTLPSDKRGELAGYAIGKHGSDILLPGALAKVASKSVKSAQELVEVCKKFQIAKETLILETAGGIGNGVKVGEVIQAGQTTIALGEELGFTAREMGQLKQAGKLEGTINSGLDKLVSQSKSQVLKTAVSQNKHVKMVIDYLDKPAKEIQKGISSYEKQIAIHKDKIANPINHYPDWDKLDPRQREALVNKKWPAEIQVYEEQRSVLQSILNERLSHE